MALPTCCSAFRGWVAGCFPILVVVAALAVKCETEPLPIVSWQVPDPVVTLHEPVLLRLVVEHLSLDEVTVDLGVDGAGGVRCHDHHSRGSRPALPCAPARGIARGHRGPC